MKLKKELQRVILSLQRLDDLSVGKVHVITFFECKLILIN